MGGGGIMLTSLEVFQLYYAMGYKFKTSNNETEYEVVIASLRLAISLKVKRLRVWTDSCLVVGHLNSMFEAK